MVLLESNLSLRLHALCAAPWYLPVMWQWSRTESSCPATTRGFKNMTAGTSVMGMPVFSNDHHRFWVSYYSLDLALFLLKCFKLALCCCWPSVNHGWFSLAITQDYYSHSCMCHATVSVVRCSVLGLVLVLSLWWWGPQSQRKRCMGSGVVCDGSGRWEYFALFRNLRPDCRLTYSATFWLVRFQKVFPAVALAMKIFSQKYLRSLCLD